jgi:hypothetical protein
MGAKICPAKIYASLQILAFDWLVFSKNGITQIDNIQLAHI